MTTPLAPQYTTQPKASGKGCLFWGGIVFGVLFLCVVLAGIGGYCFVRHLINEYTDDKPIIVAVTPLSDADAKAVEARIENFDKSLTNGTTVEPLTLTANEINALLLKKNNAPGSARLYFSFNTNRIQAQLSISGDMFNFRMLRGRYLNGSGDFKVALNDGQLVLNIQSLSVKGKPFPDQFMQSIRNQNFADVVMTNDVVFSNALMRLQEIRIEDGKLIVVPRTTEPEAAPKLESVK